jgi:hypothetical protein
MKRIVIASILALAALAGGSAQARQGNLEIQHYWVYCIDDKTSVEQWDLEQMKVRRGSNVCLLYTDTSVSGAQKWMDMNFPTHECYCHPGS